MRRSEIRGFPQWPDLAIGAALTLGLLATTTTPAVGARRGPDDLVASTFLGGTSLDQAQAVASDPQGGFVVAGSTHSIGFPTTPGAYEREPSGNADVFVARFDAAGTLVFSTLLGGVGWEFAETVKVDPHGDILLAGWTDSEDFPTTNGAYDRTLEASYDVFVTKLREDGTGLVFSTFLGGDGIDAAYGLVVDAAGRVTVVGQSESSDFPTTPGAFDRTPAGEGDVFVTSLNPAGSSLAASTLLGGTKAEIGHAVALDARGRVVVAGATLSANFPTTAGAYDRSHDLQNDVFVSRLDRALATLSFSTFVGGPNEDQGLSLAIDQAGALYVAGAAGRMYPTTPGAFDTKVDSARDAFVTKLNGAASALIYSTALGGPGPDDGQDMVVDPSGRVLVTGSTISPTFPTTPGAYDPTFNDVGHPDAFLTRLDASGSALSYSTFLGSGDGFEEGHALFLDGGLVRIVGSTYSAGFPVVAGGFDGTYNGGGDAFVATFDI